MTAAQTLELLLSNLRKYVVELNRLSRIPKEALLADEDKLGSVKYHFIVAIESAIDIAHHLIAEYRLRIPEDYSDSIKTLEEANIIPTSLSKKLQAMTKFRNLLVHLYGKVDDEKVYQYLTSNLGDFNDFAKAIAKQ